MMEVLNDCEIIKTTYFETCMDCYKSYEGKHRSTVSKAPPIWYTDALKGGKILREKAIIMNHPVNVFYFKQSEISLRYLMLICNDNTSMVVTLQNFPVDHKYLVELLH